MPHAIRQGDIPGVQLRCERSYPVPAAELWDWLIEARRLCRWLAGGVERRDDGWRLSGVDEEGRELVEDLREIARDEGRRLVLVFERTGEGWENATRLILEVGGTERGKVSVRQEGFQRLSLSRCLTVWEFYRRRWRRALERLDEAIAGSSDAPLDAARRL